MHRHFADGASVAVELEIVGGLSADYIRRFSKRHFSSTKAAGKYMARVAEYLDAMGVRAAHQMSAYDSAGRDVTAECWALVYGAQGGVLK